MESKFIPVRGNPSSPTKNTNYPFGVIGIFLCMEDGVEVYPRQGKSIFPHQKYRLPVWVVGIFYAFSRRERSGRALPSPRGEGAERSEADEVERSRPPPVPPVVPPNPTTPHPSRRTAAPPSPQGEGLQAPLWLYRCSDALGEAVYTRPSHPRCAQPRGQLPPRQAAHERVKAVGTHRQPAAHARPQIRLFPRRQRRKTHLASPHPRSPLSA